MSQLAEDALVTLLVQWIATHRPADIPASVPVLGAVRDELRTRPCIVLETSEARSVSAMAGTFRMKLDVHLFSQTDDTPAAAHASMAAALESLLGDSAVIIAATGSQDFLLHALIPRETSTVPDESRGRETVLSFEAVVSAG
jgi:hypothetical protein